MTPDEIAALMEDVARKLLGEPNQRLSTKTELRFGSHGSVAVHLDKGTYYDHENGEGGGVLHLIEVKIGRGNGAVAAWLKDNLGVDLKGPKVEKPKRRIVATYDYRDAAGKLRFQVCRYEPKGFSQQRPDCGEWIPNMNGVELVLYRLPELIAADTVYVAEGEKDCDNLAKLGLAATTNPGGTKKWRATFAPYFAGKNVVVLPDNDAAGREHAKGVAANLTPVAASVTVVALPGLAEKGDVSDWIAAGGTAEQLAKLTANAASDADEPDTEARPPDDPAALDRMRAAIASQITNPEHQKKLLEAALLKPGDFEAQRKEIGNELSLRQDFLKDCVKLALAAADARSETDEPDERRGQRDELLRIAREMSVFWRDAADVAYATVNGREHYRVKSTAYRRLLVRAYGDANMVAGHPAAPGAQALAEALVAIDAEAGRGPIDFPKLRIAGSVRGSVYVDLGDDTWRAVEVTAAGWRIIDDPPVKFIRAPGMLPLPAPRKGKGGAKLLKHLGVKDEASRLVIGWLIGCFSPQGHYAILALHGEAGSGKSTLTKMLRELVDPNRAAERSRPKDERDLVIGATNAWLPSFGNLSSIDQDLSDALCRISTGSGFATRTLYTDAEETIFAACRPQIINGIPDLARSDDLADRCVNVVLPVRDEASRGFEAEMWSAFEADLPEMLGFLLDAVACALRRLDEVVLNRPPRLMDFARWVEAAAPKLGWKPGEFLKDYRVSRERMARTIVDGDVVALVLLKMIAGQKENTFKGTSAELLVKLGGFASDEDKKNRRWPRNPTALGIRMRRIAPALRKLGWEVDLDVRTEHAREILLRSAASEKSDEQVSEVSEVSEGQQPRGFAPDTSASSRCQRRHPGADGHDTSDTSPSEGVSRDPSNGAASDTPDTSDALSANFSKDGGGEHDFEAEGRARFGDDA